MKHSRIGVCINPCPIFKRFLTVNGHEFMQSFNTLKKLMFDNKHKNVEYNTM